MKLRVIMNYKILIFLLFSLNVFTQQHASMIKNTYPFDRVVIWGHKLGSHTHSWIHWAFNRAFQHLGYETFWLDNKDDISNIDFSNTLFITEGQVDQNIPLRSDCRYILHNCDEAKYGDLSQQGNCINLQVYTHKCLKDNVDKIDDYIYVNYKSHYIYMPWATDLLPHEIEENKKKIESIHKEPYIVWIGTIGGGKFGNIQEITPFKDAATKDGILFFHKFMHTSMKDNIKYIQTAYMAPTIVGTWQLKEGYIPCRIFKNISYGAMGITNSKTVYDLCKQKIVYNEDCKRLYQDAKERLQNVSLEELFELMDFIKEKHTYINRIEHPLAFLTEIKPLKK